MTGERVLVTGASGFIGRALCRRLADAGCDVRAVVRSPDPIADGVAVMVVGEIGGETEWGAALQGVSVVVHLAGRAHRTGADAEDEEPFERVNHQGTRRLAEAIRDVASVKRLVFLSSVAAVGSFSARPLQGGEERLPDTPYGRSKLAAESAVVRTLDSTECDWCTLRPPLVYGPGNPGNMGRLLRLIRAAPLLPLGGIDNARSFLFLDNLLDAIVVVIEARSVSRTTLYVADDEVTSTPDLIRALARAAGREVRLVSVPKVFLRLAGRAGDFLGAMGLPAPVSTYTVDRLRGSLVVRADELKRLTGWEPAVTLTDGLARMIG